MAREGAVSSCYERCLTVAVALGAALPLLACASSAERSETEAVGRQVEPLTTTSFQAENATIGQGEVETEHAGFTGVGYVNTDNVAGSFVQWTVDSPITSTAGIDFRYANGASLRTVDIVVNGVVVFAGFPFGGTGAWTSWSTVGIDTTLAQGPNTIRLVSANAAGGPNYDRLDVTFNSQGGANQSLQAEVANYFRAEIETEHAGFTGTGYVNTFNETGSYIEWTVHSAAAGPTDLLWTYANGSGAVRLVDVLVNDVAVFAQFPFGGTGAWTSWTTIGFESQLAAGVNRIRLVSATAEGGPNYDRLDVSRQVRRPLHLAVGTDHACALVESGAVRCWGGNGSGQLGLGSDAGSLDSVGDDEHPSAVPDVNLGGAALQLSAGHAHNCAVLTGGNVRCWGRGTSGQLGYGNTNDIGDNETPASAGNVNVGAAVAQVSAGTTHSCALRTNGTVRCWGEGLDGKLGYGNTNSIGDNEAPATAGNVNVGGTVVQVSAGSRHTCALLNNGAVRCWGLGAQGALGYGNTNSIGDNETPASAGNVNVGGTVVQIGTGLSHTCALLNNGAVRCWGNGVLGVLGYGNTNSIGDNETPASAGNVNVGGPVASISVATNRTCAVLTTGAVRCWGAGSEVPLGYGNFLTIGDNETPASAGSLSVGGPVAEIAAGELHICALLQSGDIRCWGESSEGKLGIPGSGTIGDNEFPSAFPPIQLE